MAKNLAFEPRTGNLGSLLAQDVPEIKLAMNRAEPAPVEARLKEAKGADAKAVDAEAGDAKAASGATSSGCRQDADGAGWLAPLVVLWAGRRRRAASAPRSAEPG